MKISVVTVSFNSGNTIADTIASVAMQSHNNVEHLIIDGGSTDSTLDVLQSKINPNMKVISERDNGIYDAMNKGLKLATGDIIGFLNSDDMFADAYSLEKIVKSFQNPNVDVCYGDLVYLTQNKKRAVRYWKSKVYRKGDFGKGWCPAHPTFYIRRSAYERIGFFDLSYKLAADVEFMMRYLEIWGLVSIYIPSVLVHMRLGGVSNRSLKNISLQNQEIFHALNKNNINFSKKRFVFKKIFNRLIQFYNGLKYKDSATLIEL